jgi:hypothetical protein
MLPRLECRFNRYRTDKNRKVTDCVIDLEPPCNGRANQNSVFGGTRTEGEAGKRPSARAAQVPYRLSDATMHSATVSILLSSGE